MRRIVTLCAVLALLVASNLSGQQVVRLVEIPVAGIPAGSAVRGYAVQELSLQSQIVVETVDRDGVVGLYALDLVDGALSGRLVGPANVPTRFHKVDSVQPVIRELAVFPAVDTYWSVGGDGSPISNSQFVTSVPLRDLRFIEIVDPPGPEMPSPSSPLAIRYIVVDAGGTVSSSCILEPNLISGSRRLTTTGAYWIRVHGGYFLFVGFVIDGGSGTQKGFFRLYTEALEVAYESPVLYRVDPNRVLPPLFVDLTGDGAREIVIFTDLEDDRPFVVLHPEPGSDTGLRTIGYNGCGTRMNGPDVLAVQRELASAGFSVGQYGLDGWYGPDTRGAVIAFQRENGLPATGVVNDATWRALGNAE